MISLESYDYLDIIIEISYLKLKSEPVYKLHDGR